jgi:hypothetical protein
LHVVCPVYELVNNSIHSNEINLPYISADFGTIEYSDLQSQKSIQTIISVAESIKTPELILE